MASFLPETAAEPIGDVHITFFDNKDKENAPNPALDPMRDMLRNDDLVGKITAALAERSSSSAPKGGGRRRRRPLTSQAAPRRDALLSHSEKRQREDFLVAQRQIADESANTYRRHRPDALKCTSAFTSERNASVKSDNFLAAQAARDRGTERKATAHLTHWPEQWAKIRATIAVMGDRDSPTWHYNYREECRSDACGQNLMFFSCTAGGTTLSYFLAAISSAEFVSTWVGNKALHLDGPNFHREEMPEIKKTIQGGQDLGFEFVLDQIYRGETLAEIERCRVYKSLERLRRFQNDVESMTMTAFRNFIFPDACVCGVPGRLIKLYIALEFDLDPWCDFGESPTS